MAFDTGTSSFVFQIEDVCVIFANLSHMSVLTYKLYCAVTLLIWLDLYSFEKAKKETGRLNSTINRAEWLTQKCWNSQNRKFYLRLKTDKFETFENKQGKLNWAQFFVVMRKYLAEKPLNVMWMWIFGLETNMNVNFWKETKYRVKLIWVKTLVLMKRDFATNCCKLCWNINYETLSLSEGAQTLMEE